MRVGGRGSRPSSTAWSISLQRCAPRFSIASAAATTSFGERSKPWPLVSTLALVGFVVVLLVGFADGIQRLGHVTAYSVGQMLLSVVFAATSIWGLSAVLRARRVPLNRAVWWHSLLVAVPVALSPCISSPGD